MSIARDVSGQDLVAAQEALQRATERMENMLESLTDGFCAVDRNWNITYINGRALQMVEPLNKRRGDLVGAKLWDEFEDLHGTTVALDCVRAMEQRVTVNREFYYRRLNAWLDMRVYPSPEGLTLYFQDITARKLDQQALIDNNNRLQLAIAAGRLGDWRCSPSPHNRPTRPPPRPPLVPRSTRSRPPPPTGPPPYHRRGQACASGCNPKTARSSGAPCWPPSRRAPTSISNAACSRAATWPAAPRTAWLWSAAPTTPAPSTAAASWA